MLAAATGLLGAVAAFASGVPGCYTPSFRDCQLSCGGPTGCPVDLFCVSEFCRLSRTPETSCLAADASLPGHDASTDAANGTDAQVVDAPVIDASTDALTVDASPIDASPPDAPLPDAACICDPLTQSCCPSGNACDVQGGQTRCREVAVAGQQAAECVNAPQCAAGYSCVPYGSTATGTCHAFCDADSDCVGGGALCDVRVGSSWTVCTSFCDPLSGSGCEEGWACELAKSSFSGRWHTDCRPSGLVNVGDPCTRNADCGRGFVCAGSPARCVSYCNSQQQDDSGCPGTPTCQTDAASPVIDGIKWGACL